MKICFLLFLYFITALEGSLALSSSAFKFQQSSLVNDYRKTGHGAIKYNIEPDSEVVDQLIRDIVTSKYVDDSFFRESLAQLKAEVNNEDKVKEFNKLLSKYVEDNESKSHASTTQDGSSIWDRSMNFLRGLFGDDNSQNGDQNNPSDDTSPTEDDETIMGDIEKYLGSLTDGTKETFHEILNYIVNYVHRNVHFWLYTKRHDGFQDIAIGKQANITKSNFKKWKKTIVLIHGWINSGDNNYALNMVKAFNKYGDYNIISVDWSELSYSFYTLSRLSVNFIGPYVAQMIDFLAKYHDLNVADLHILGHSLGAHIAGITGMFVKHGKVGHITGFDPASPLFGDNQKYRLDASDGKFVDVIHTSLLGMTDQLGHIDFYPNGGGPTQPGCGIDIAVCPHRRSYQYYIASMRDNNFLAFPCDSWDSFTSGNCTTKQIHMGIHVPKTVKGKYFLKTAGEAPFALGIKTLDFNETNDDPTPMPIHQHHKYKPKYELV